MYKLLASSTLLLASYSISALAADDIGALTYQEQTNWSGVYVGVHGGYAWLQGNDSLGNTQSFDGFLGGFHLGYNHVIDQFVVGAEVDGSLLEASGTSALGVRTSADWVASARVRAGVAIDPALLFVTGGFSAGSLELANPVRGTTSRNTHVGWVVGAGIEAFLADDISARLEYQHHDFGNQTYNLGAASFQLDGKVDLVRIGLTYHF